MKDPLRVKLNLIVAAALAFVLGLGMASAFDLTSLSLAAGERDAPKLVIGAGSADVDVSKGFAEIVQRVAPAVVTIEVEQAIQVANAPGGIPQPFDDFFRGEGEDDQPRIVPGNGSGFIISDDGYILTNNHVVEAADNIVVELADGRRFDPVEVVGRDPQTDVALLKIDGNGLTAVPLGFSDSTQVGDWVLAIGSPGFQLGTRAGLRTTVTAGIVSAKGRNIGILGNRFLLRQQPNLAIEDFIQTDAAINPGNSGGPLVNGRGEVIGINTAIASNSGQNQGYGFAVPIELVREVMDDLIEYGEVRRALIGVSIQDIDAYDAEYYKLDRVAGAKVSEVGLVGGEPGPAAAAGIERGDVIVGVNGERIGSVGDLQRRIRAHEPGESVILQVVRGASEEKVEEDVPVKLAAAATPETSSEPTIAAVIDDDPLGIEVSEIPSRLRRGIPEDVEGVLIEEVDRRGPAGRARIGRGLIITALNGRTVEDEEDYDRLMAEIEPGSVVNLVLYSPRTRNHVILSVPTSER